MAKVPKVKKRETSIHSRAHRRNASPAPDLTKGLSKTTTKESAADDNEHWLYNTQNTGVQKKKPKTKKLTRQQRQRQLKLLEHADRNVDKHERKVENSKQRGRRVQARRKDWDELNGVAATKVTKALEDGKGSDIEGMEETESLDDDVSQTNPSLEHPSKFPAAGESAAIQPTQISTNQFGATVEADAIDEIT